MPSAQELIDYGVRVEKLGYESIWAWDHILLGVEPSFPIIEALSILTAIAARTQTLKLGTGVLVMPMRNPVILAKELASLDLISNGRLIVGTAVGWYKREFKAMGVDFHERGKIMERSLDIIKRLWTENRVTEDFPPYLIKDAVMYPKPVQKPHPPILIGGYVDAVLRRAATKGDGWLTYYYTADSFASNWARVRALRRGGGPQPGRADLHQPASDLRRPAFEGRSAHARVAADGLGLRLVVRIHRGERDHGHRGRVRGATAEARRDRRGSPDLRPLPLSGRAAGDHRQGDHPAAEEELGASSPRRLSAPHPVPFREEREVSRLLHAPCTLSG